MEGRSKEPMDVRAQGVSHARSWAHPPSPLTALLILDNPRRLCALVSPSVKWEWLGVSYGAAGRRS